MGLDMYLYAEKYIPSWTPEGEAAAKTVATAIQAPQGWTTAYVRGQVAYWRKANAVHDWFVQNCQGGRDECQLTSVEKEHLEDLITVCERVLDNPSQAEELLPTRNGFFFGSTSYDDYYLQDLRDTISQLKPLLTEDYQHWDFYYRSSW